MAKDKEMDNVNYGGIEINSDSKEYVNTSAYPLDDVRIAYAIFIPNIEKIESSISPMSKAMQIVEFQASKVAFKYEQEDNWIYYYGLVVDSESHGCSKNGTPAVMIQMPYSTKNETRAKEDLIIFVKEIAVLCGIEDVVLNYNINTAFHVNCKFIDNENKCLETFDSYTYEELKVDLNISCVIEEGIQFAGMDLYNAISSIGNTLDPAGIIYYQAGGYVYGRNPNVERCQLISSNRQVQNLEGLKIPKIFEESVAKEIELAKLKINNYTVI